MAGLNRRGLCASLDATLDASSALFVRIGVALSVDLVVAFLLLRRQDLTDARPGARPHFLGGGAFGEQLALRKFLAGILEDRFDLRNLFIIQIQIGRASCRERV